MNDLKLLMQAVVVVKAMARGYGVTPLTVELVEGTSAESIAWEQEAEKYLRARQNGVKYKPETRNYLDELELT